MKVFPGSEKTQFARRRCPLFAKNIAKNFMDHYFKGEDRAIVRHEVERMKAQVISSSFLCTFSSP